MTYLNTAEAGAQMGLSAATVRRMILRRELDGFRTARQFRTTQEAVDAYKAARTPALTTNLADSADTGAIERLAELLRDSPKWLWDKSAPVPAGYEPLHGALA